MGTLGVASASSSADNSKPPEGCRGILLKSLAFAASDQDIREVFKDCGAGPTRVRLLTWPNGESKGKAFVDFPDAASVEAAMKMSGEELHDRRLVMEFCKPAPGILATAGAHA